MKTLSLILLMASFASLCSAKLTSETEKTELGERTTYYRYGNKILVEEYFDIGDKENGRRYYDQSVWMKDQVVMFISTFLETPKWDYYGVEGVKIIALPQGGLLTIQHKNRDEGYNIADDGLLSPYDDEQYKESFESQIFKGKPSR